MASHKSRLTIDRSKAANVPVPPTLQGKSLPILPLAQRRRAPPPRFHDMMSEAKRRIVEGGPSAAGLGMNRLPSQLLPNSQYSTETPFSTFNREGLIDAQGALRFKGKAVINQHGVNFINGDVFKINMEEMVLGRELGKGNYGAVRRVLHKPTNVEMAMKEILLQLDKQMFQAIQTELDVLHKSSISPQIVEFYGAFFTEGHVYYCMEYMDLGSIDKLVIFPNRDPVTREKKLPDGSIEKEVIEWEGVPEDVLAHIAGEMVRGLRFLKDSMKIMHRDVKPTNVLLNRKGQIKLCDFGVSGKLDQSMAKTVIGCQTYMAPERISRSVVETDDGSDINDGSYTVAADVWSLGISIMEIAKGEYPYPPESYKNILAQLDAIAHSPPPKLSNKYSESARDWVAQCMQQDPNKRATYAQLLEHPWIASTRETDMVGWVNRLLRYHGRDVEEPMTIPNLNAHMNGMSLGPMSLSKMSVSAPAVPRGRDITNSLPPHLLRSRPSIPPSPIPKPISTAPNDT